MEDVKMAEHSKKKPTYDFTCEIKMVIITFAIKILSGTQIYLRYCVMCSLVSLNPLK